MLQASKQEQRPGLEAERAGGLKGSVWLAPRLWEAGEEATALPGEDGGRRGRTWRQPALGANGGGVGRGVMDMPCPLSCWLQPHTLGRHPGRLE